MISVIIPSDGQTDVLKICLDKLGNQSLSSDLYEVIVIFNTEKSNDLEEFAKGYNIKFDFEPENGSYAARNLGISLAQQDILAFTDADCAPSCNWLKNILDIFNSLPKVQIIGGQISTFPKNVNNITSSEYLDLIFSFNQKKYIQTMNFSATANMVVRRATLDKVGPFKETMLSGGDKEWGNRATKMGYKIKYFDQVLVFHPARDTLKMQLKKRKRISRGLYHYEVIINRKPVKYLFKTIKLFFPPLNQIKDILTYNQDRISNNPWKKLITIAQLILMRVYSGIWRIILLF